MRSVILFVVAAVTLTGCASSAHIAKPLRHPRGGVVVFRDRDEAVDEIIEYCGKHYRVVDEGEYGNHPSSFTVTYGEQNVAMPVFKNRSYIVFRCNSD